MATRHNHHFDGFYNNFNEIFVLAFTKVKNYEVATRVTERVLHQFAQSGKTLKGLSVYKSTLSFTILESGDEGAFSTEDERLHAFLQMDEYTRLILALTYVHQLEQEQVGEVMNLPVHVVNKTVEDVHWKEEFTNSLLNLCDEETRQMVKVNVEKQLAKMKSKKKALKYGSAVVALLLFLAIGSYVIQKPFTEERVEASPPVHEVIYERLSQQGYPQIKVGLTKEEEQIIIQVVGPASYYQDVRKKVKSVAREMLNERGYERYGILVKPMAVERHISN
ncbi:hypothetical protein H0266_04705 [Halobacillus locisalis]|uniref:Uncharacterized protein n=1 Tax=Halobacillus locisalis TaxID=220753 RepID=A0A838CQC7_9BACI|nr:hypothetical protein [Halobacillus locisalis]MBA2174200.1 hypothetical protein [Halobacillus locisalis]